MSGSKEADWLIISIVTTIVLAFFLMWTFGGGHMTGIMGYYGTGYMFVIILAFGLIALGLYLILSRTSSSSVRGRRAIEILKERYAKGEITKEQFLKMREELES